MHSQTTIGLWCNGNTTDSGPVIPGSNPGSPTKQKRSKEMSKNFDIFFVLRLRHANLFAGRRGETKRGGFINSLRSKCFAKPPRQAATAKGRLPCAIYHSSQRRPKAVHLTQSPTTQYPTNPKKSAFTTLGEKSRRWRPKAVHLTQSTTTQYPSNQKSVLGG